MCFRENCEEKYHGNCRGCLVLLARCVFPRTGHTQSGIQLYARFWSVVLDCDSEPKIKMLFLSFTSSKKDGFPAGVNDEMSANLQTPQWNLMKFLKLRVKFFRSSKRQKLSHFFWNKGSNFSPIGKNKAFCYLFFNKNPLSNIFFLSWKRLQALFLQCSPSLTQLADFLPQLQFFLHSEVRKEQDQQATHLAVSLSNWNKETIF